MAWSSGYQLRILKGKQQGLIIPLIEQKYILGRATSQGETAPGYMFFYEPTVSRVHAELRWNDKKKSYFVHHQSKTNPTLVEGTPVADKSPRPLENGHKIQLGYLILTLEPASIGPVATTSAPQPTSTSLPKEDASKTHKMMVGNILEALSNLGTERNAASSGHLAPASPPTSSPATQFNKPTNPAKERQEANEPATGGTTEIQFMVTHGPNQGEVFVLKEQVGVIGRAFGRDDPRQGQGVLLHDDSLPEEAAYVVWQNREGAYGLSESDTPGIVIRVRRSRQGLPQDIAVSHGPPVLLQDGDVIQLGRSALICRVKGAAPLKQWTPQSSERSARPHPSSVALPPSPPPVSPQEDWSQPSLPSPWGRPSDPPTAVRSIPLKTNEVPAASANTGSIVPRNFPGTSEVAGTGAASTSSSQPLNPDYSIENRVPDDVQPPTSPFRLPKSPSRIEPTLFGRSSTGSKGSPSESSQTVTPKAQPVVSQSPVNLSTPDTTLPTTPLDPSSVPTLSSSHSNRPPTSGVADDHLPELQALSWPWRNTCDFVFDFISGTQRNRQIALNVDELYDDRVITMGCNSEQFNIPLDGNNNMAALRYRSRRFALLNQGPDDSVMVNRVPLKRGDQVILMTGDYIEIGQSAFRYLERAVVDILQKFQLVVESGVDQDQDKVFPFAKQRLLLGRGKNCDIRLNDLEVSRVHVALVHRDSRFFVQHRSETNPTFLNGMSLLQGGEREIQAGDRIRLSSLTLLQLTKVELAEPGKRASISGR